MDKLSMADCLDCIASAPWGCSKHRVRTQGVGPSRTQAGDGEGSGPSPKTAQEAKTPRGQTWETDSLFDASAKLLRLTKKLAGLESGRTVKLLSTQILNAVQSIEEWPLLTQHPQAEGSESQVARFLGEGNWTVRIKNGHIDQIQTADPQGDGSAPTGGQNAG